MSEQSPQQKPAKAAPVQSKMDKIVALCKRRGFIFQSSEIYGGINGFWDYGPLGTELKRNLKNAWYHDIVRCPPLGPDGQPIEMVPLDCTIIMNPKVWVASGHVGGFNDPMVDDKETKQRFRADHLHAVFLLNRPDEIPSGINVSMPVPPNDQIPLATIIGSSPMEALSLILEDKAFRKKHGIQSDSIEEPVIEIESPVPAYTTARKWVSTNRGPRLVFTRSIPLDLFKHLAAAIPSPFTGKAGALTEPRMFNLMFKTYVGAIESDDSLAYLRPETAQGIFANFRNVTDTTRVRIPFGIAQQGKAFRNEVTPRNYTFRSREFEQMEIEFFIRPPASCRPGDLTPADWYKFWRDSRFQWWQSIGLAGTNLQLREHDKDELAHYAKEGAGTSDIEYKFPFTDPGYGELEGVAHRADFDLRQHAQHSGLGDNLKYFDQELQVKLQAEGMPKEEINKLCKYFPHVIEPSAGADRGTLALLCEAYADDPARPSGVVMKFHPRMAPIKAAIFPLVDKDGMPEIAAKLFNDLRQTWSVQTDNKQSIGKRYARMDEAGTPFCFTVDTQTLSDQTVTVRHRDTLQQERVNVSQVRAFLTDKIR
jgi:glycyl-tRNA synthetase